MTDVYCIDGSHAIARFRIASSDDRSLVFLHDGHATISLSPEDAQALASALIAVARGEYSVAETALATQLRKEATAARERRQQEARARADVPAIDYDNLFGETNDQ